MARREDGGRGSRWHAFLDVGMWLLFFPGVAANRTDGIFTSECLVDRWRTANGRRLARFDFVLDLS